MHGDISYDKASLKSDSTAFKRFLNDMAEKRCKWDTSNTNHFGRTILCAPVDSLLTIALLNKNERLMKLLHNNFAL